MRVGSAVASTIRSDQAQGLGEPPDRSGNLAPRTRHAVQEDQCWRFTRAMFVECMVLPWDMPEGRERLVLLRQSGHRPAIDTYVLRHRLGLTPVEADVLARLMIGEGVPEIAEQRGSTAETIRSYLKNLRGRLKCHSQGQLIAHAWRALGFVPSALPR